MNILFDINHPVDVNFFKNAIRKLVNGGHNIIITYRPRGKLQSIVNFELGKFSPKKIGKHYTAFIMKIIGQLKRDFVFLSFQRRNMVDLSVCFGPTNVIASWLNRIPYLAFEDDFEYKIPFYHANIFATRHIMPSYINVKKKNIYHYKGLKEIAYLHPIYFTPQSNELQKYGLKPNKYVFIRKIANVSLNYKKEDNLNLFVIQKIKKLGLEILLSLEDKKMKNYFKDYCIILEEPVNDVYSLMKYALFTISSGDSVARESCVLGVHAIYVGGREMLVNKELIDMGFMFKEDTVEEILNRISYLAKNDGRENIEKLIKFKIENEWDDPTEIILKHIKDFEI